MIKGPGWWLGCVRYFVSTWVLSVCRVISLSTTEERGDPKQDTSCRQDGKGLLCAKVRSQ